MMWTLLDTWIVVAAGLSAASCALLGNFLVLRKMSMMGDAISHAVLPGLAAAFLISQSRSGPAMFIGAAIVGLLTAVLTQWIHSAGKVEESAAMGVTFTGLFALGLVMIVRAADKVDLDPGCVLYGAIELTPLDTVSLFGIELPRAVVILGAMLLVNLLFVGLFYKELRITSFDPSLATTLGIDSRVMHYLLMTLVAITTVASFESVGSILVIAMLIVPAATAHLLTDRYGGMLLLSMVIAVLAAGLGHVSAITVPTWFGYADTNTAGMMAVVAGLLFAGAMMAAPRYGILSRLVHRIALSLRITREDVLGLIWRMEESGFPSATAPNIPLLLRDTIGASTMLGRVAVWDLLRRRRISSVGGGRFTLTDRGRTEASQLVRAHRLWESYLDKHFALPADHLHHSAERTEHFITTLVDEHGDEIPQEPTDPHGRDIPPAVEDAEQAAAPKGRIRRRKSARGPRGKGGSS